MNRWLAVAPVLFALGAVAGACSHAADAEHETPRVVGHVPPGALPAPTDQAVIDSLRAREPGALATVLSAPVTGFTGPDGRPFEVASRTGGSVAGHARRFGRITRSTALRPRAPDIGQYPCTSCHFGRSVVMRDTRIADAHQNIQPSHPARLGAVCANCHAPENVERLALRSGERPTLDHAYRLCAQCHFQQANEWAGGAHGKRLDGWQGRRIVMGCADCHDPHQPSLEPRAPFRAPRIERPRGLPK